MLGHGCRRHGADRRARVTVRARTFVAAAGAIGTPALLLRSGVPDPHALVGKRTFLHPTVVSRRGHAATGRRLRRRAADRLLRSLPRHAAAIDGPIGFKLEAPPIHPILAAITLPGYGAAARALDARASRTCRCRSRCCATASIRKAPGGIVRLRDDGTPVLDYPLTPYLWDGVRRAFLAMAEIQFAAGARHGDADARRGRAVRDLRRRPRAAHRRVRPARRSTTPVVSAHVMGGCPIGSDARARSSTSTGAASTIGEPLRVRRLALPDVDRRQSAAVDLRVRGEARRGIATTHAARATSLISVICSSEVRGRSIPMRGTRATHMHSSKETCNAHTINSRTPSCPTPSSTRRARSGSPASAPPSSRATGRSAKRARCSARW